MELTELKSGRSAVFAYETGPYKKTLIHPQPKSRLLIYKIRIDKI